MEVSCSQEQKLKHSVRSPPAQKKVKLEGNKAGLAPSFVSITSSALFPFLFLLLPCDISEGLGQTSDLAFQLYYIKYRLTHIKK